MTQEDAESQATRGWRTKAGWFLHELGTLILILALVAGILLFLVGVFLATYPPAAEEGAISIILGLLLAGISIALLVARG